jgi:antitoxin (DNA-binding transcriptional repressor) of toxin-antitoxin stability system
MAPLLDGGDGKPQRLSQRVSEMFVRPARMPKIAAAPDAATDPDKILSPAERRAAMSSLSAVEVKWSKVGLAVSAVLGVVFTLYLRTAHSNKTVTVTRHGKKVKELVPISDSWILLGAVILVFCLIGGVAVQRRKRTLLVFSLFVIGFSFTLIFAPLGFAIIVLGGWLMLRAYRIQKFGTPVAKMAAKQAAARPPRRERKKAAQIPPKPSGHQPPSANKRYTPKAAPRKKVVKPTK